MARVYKGAPTVLPRLLLHHHSQRKYLTRLNFHLRPLFNKSQYSSDIHIPFQLQTTSNSTQQLKMSNKGSPRLIEWVNDQCVPLCDNNSVKSHSTTGRKHGKGDSLLVRALTSLGSPSVRENASQAGSAKHSIKSSSTMRNGKSPSKVSSHKDNASQAGSDRHSVRSNSTVRDNTRAPILPKHQKSGNAPPPPSSYQGTTHSSIASERAPSQSGSAHYSSNIPVIPKPPSPFLGDFSGSTYDKSASAVARQSYNTILASPDNGDNGNLTFSLPTSHRRDSKPESGDITYTLTQLQVHISGKKSSAGKGSSR